MSKVNFIRNYAKKNLLKTTDEGIMIIPNTQKVDFQEGILRQLLIENGINPDAIKSDGAMNEAMAFINQSQKTTSTATDAKLFDLEGRRLDPNEPIMGGTQEESIKKNIAAATKKGDFTGIANQVLRDPDIAREFMLSKKFPFSRDTNVRSGADAIPLARKAEFDEEMKMKDMAKERNYDVEQLVSDFKKFGNATDKDIQTILGSGKAGQIPYVMDNYGMSFTEVLDTLKKGKPLIEGLAKGGRIGFSQGLGPRFIKFLSENSPVQAFKKYNKSVKDRMQQGKELEVASEVIPIAASGALVTNQLKKMLKNMNEEQKKEQQDKMFKEFSQEYKEKYKDSPELLEKMLLDLHKNIYMEEKADGGRIGFKEGNGAGDGITGITLSIEERMERIRKLLKQMQDIQKGKGIDPDPEEKADGGRIGLKDGMDRRTFMKIMGGLATIPILGKFFKTGKTAKIAKDATKVVPNTQPPSYFFSLAEKIKLLGKESKVKPQERVNEYYYTGKNGDEYTLTEDISTGDMQIVKDKTGVGVYNDKSFDTINDRTVMDYKKGRGDETTKGTPPDEYDEYKVEFDQDGTMAGADDISEIIKKEIVDEVSDNIPSIKKASGGIARMLGE